ncbi:MAG: PKD domain-containing protein [bacterium]
MKFRSFDLNVVSIIIAIFIFCSLYLEPALGEAIAPLYKGEILNAMFSPDGSLFIVMTANGIYLYNTAGYKEIAFIETDNPINYIKFNNDGALFVTGSNDNTVRLWDAKEHLEIAILSGHKARITAVNFSPDGNIIASGSEDGIVKLWDAKTRFFITNLVGHNSKIMFVNFSPDNNMIITGSEDNIVKLWDAKTYQELGTLRGKLDWFLSDALLARMIAPKRPKYVEKLKVNELKVPESAIIAGDTAVLQTVADYTGDESALNYTWSASAGSILGKGNKATYKAPDTPGSYSVNVRASDGAIASERTAEISVESPSSFASLLIDTNKYWPAIALKDKISYNVKVDRLTGGRVILHYDITQDKDNYDAFLSIEIGKRIILQDMAIGNEQPSTGIRTIRDIDVSDVITEPGQYIINLYIRPGDRAQNGWLLNEASLIGVEGSSESL